MCHLLDPSVTTTRTSLIGFGRHLQSKHPAWANHDQHKRRSKRIIKTLQDVAFAKEVRRFERSGLRRIPIKRFDDRHLDQISSFVRKVEQDATANLLLSSISYADERFRSRQSFETAVRALQSATAAGIKSGVYVTSERKTHFDPRVAVEVLKLCWALGRGWSFVVHLLLLYGINAFVSDLNRDGIAVPTKVRTLPEPSAYLRSTAKNIDAILEELE